MSDPTMTAVQPQEAIFTAVVRELRARGCEVEHEWRRPMQVQVRRAEWPTSFWCHLECKTPRGALTPEQRESLAAGGIVVVRSVADALAAVRAAAEALGVRS